MNISESLKKDAVIALNNKEEKFSFGNSTYFIFSEDESGENEKIKNKLYRGQLLHEGKIYFLFK